MFGSQENQKENPHVLHKETQKNTQWPWFNHISQGPNLSHKIAINHHIKLQIPTSTTPKIQSTQIPKGKKKIYWKKERDLDVIYEDLGVIVCAKVYCLVGKNLTWGSSLAGIKQTF